MHPGGCVSKTRSNYQCLTCRGPEVTALRQRVEPTAESSLATASPRRPAVRWVIAHWPTRGRRSCQRDVSLGGHFTTPTNRKLASDRGVSSDYLRTVEPPIDESQNTSQSKSRKLVRFFIDPFKSDEEIAEAIMAMAEEASGPL